MATLSLADLLAKNSNVLLLTENNRVRCLLTDHEMPPNASVVHAYLTGKKFKKAKEWYTYDYSEFLPHIVPDKRDARKLFCRLTRHSLNKIPDEVRKHVGGKKFQRLKAEHEAKQLKKTQKVRDDDDDDDGDDGEEGDSEMDIWVPPADLLEDDGDDHDGDDGDEPDKASSSDVVPLKKGNLKKHLQVVGSQRPTRPAMEEDTMSDLIGSDHDDDSDVPRPKVGGGGGSGRGGVEDEPFDFDDDVVSMSANGDEEEDDEGTPPARAARVVGKKRPLAPAPLKKKFQHKQKKGTKGHH